MKRLFDFMLSVENFFLSKEKKFHHRNIKTILIYAKKLGYSYKIVNVPIIEEAYVSRGYINFDKKEIVVSSYWGEAQFIRTMCHELTHLLQYEVKKGSPLGIKYNTSLRVFLSFKRRERKIYSGLIKILEQEAEYMENKSKELLTLYKKYK